MISFHFQGKPYNITVIEVYALTSNAEEADPTWKQYPVVDVSSGESKVHCSKEQYNIETWNVSSMNQGKLEVVKQKMARMNIDILEI